MSGPDPLEKLEQLPLFRFGKVANRAFVRLPHFLVEPSQHIATLLSDVAEHLAPIGRAAFASSEPGFLQLVEQPCDPWRLVNHAIANDQCGQPFVAGTAEDAQYVVLLHRHPRTRHDLREMTFEQRSRSENADGDLGFDRVKGTALYDLGLQSAPVFIGRRRHHASLGSDSLCGIGTAKAPRIAM